ncbi:MAG: hypothetical protein Q9220_002239 [cf. Caloplaca sp. 1 TL-2023]
MFKRDKKAWPSGGGEDSSASSKISKPSEVDAADKELAQKLHAELNIDQASINSQDDDDGSGYPSEIQTAVDFVQRFAEESLSMTCYKCDRPLVRGLDISYWLGKWESTRKEGGSPSASSMKCKCGVRTCVGCGEAPRIGDAKFKADYDGLKLDWCCSKGAAFVALVLLSYYDDMELQMQAASLQKQATAQRQAAFREKPSGIGFGANVMGPRGTRPALVFKQADMKTDDNTRWVFGMLVELLPKKKETTKKVSPALSSMIELSLLQDRTAELLRNDSLQDVDKRAYLYFTMFEFVERLAAHPKLDYLAREGRFRKKNSAGLHTIATAGQSDRKGKNKAQLPLTVASKSQGLAASLVSCMDKLAIQSKGLLDRHDSAAAGVNLVEVAKRIQRIHGGLAIDKIAAVTTWKDYHQQHCLKWDPSVMNRLLPKMSHLALDIMASPKGRIPRLMSEVSEMATALPEGVFVRVQDERPDVMTALIIGPKDTPYEGGLFEFEIVCGPDYPHSPPIVWHATSVRANVRFNPNLYANGKVCLSLINTWEGAPETKWQPGKSTLTSVLVSIQSMIFWQWPYENEPGYENAHERGGKLAQASIEYNQYIRGATLKHANLAWLTRQHLREGLWKDVIRDYYRFCGRRVVQAARVWEKGKGFPKGRGVGLIDELEAAIEKWKG